MQKLPTWRLKHYLLPIISLFLCCMISGCGTLLPVARGKVKSPWHSFEEAKTAFDKITPNLTNKDDLQKLSFDPFINPNIEILTYLDLTGMFIPNSSFQKEDLAQEVRECLAAKDKCYGYEMVIRNMESKRYGNVLLDLFNFRRKSQKKGWQFNALLVLQDDLVVYKIWGGKPRVDEYIYKKNPLGPLQQSEGILRDIAVESTFDK